MAAEAVRRGAGPFEIYTGDSIPLVYGSVSGFKNPIYRIFTILFDIIGVLHRGQGPAGAVPIYMSIYLHQLETYF